MTKWDYIVVGAGSAGSVLANRLSAAPGRRVLLVEAGGVDLSPYIHIPAAIIRAIGNRKLDWCYLAEPDASRNGKVDLWPAGRTLGGSSSINGMLYVRGRARDYDRWSEMGCNGWDYASVLPFFRKSESCAFGDENFRGRSGPLKVSRLRSIHSLAHTFVAAALDRDFVFNEDYNGASQEGVAYSQVTQTRGQRVSASRAYLWPALSRRNLKIETRAHCERLLIENGRCIGVRYRKNGANHDALADGEVIVSAGAIASPKLLMLSGIGPAQHLKEMDIEPLIECAGVGANLKEHPEGMVGIDVNVPTYNTEINSWKIFYHVINWLFFGRGPATSPYPHCVAFLKSHRKADGPDIQLQLGPYAFSFSEDGVIPYDRPAISAAVNIAYPETTGRIELRSPKTDDPPRIFHELLASENDLRKLTIGCKIVREIFSAPAFDSFRMRERLPGEHVESDKDWADYLRKTAFLGYHPVGTCKMGVDDMSVVSPELKVNGVDGLRVADASVMPTPISGNTNAAVIMIGERAADLILQE